MPATQLAVLPVGTRYCLAAAPPLWFWVSGRCIAQGDVAAYDAAKQKLLEMDILNTRGNSVWVPS